MRNLILSFGFLVCGSLVAACGSGNTNATPAGDPSTTNASGAPTGGTSGTSETKPPEGKCGQTVTTSATALDACMADCEKLSDKAPEGSRCLPPRVECKQGCKHKFEGAK
jgi:hypothetical protein